MGSQTQKRQRVRERRREEEDLEILPLACDFLVVSNKIALFQQQHLHPHTTSNETLH
jgi:hypothetical protein